MKLNSRKNSPYTVLLVLCFGQIYPFIHFHHTHDEHGTKVVPSVHPIDYVEENHSGHHADDHEHSAPEHAIGDWDYIKPAPRQAFIQPLGFYTLSTVVTSDNPITPFVVQSINHRPPPQQVLISLAIPRGPPQLV